MEHIPTEEHLSPMERWRAYQTLVSQELNMLCQGHADRSHGVFSTLEVNPEIYEAQRLTTTTIHGSPADTDTLTTIGLSVNPERPENFTDMLEALFRAEEQKRLITSIGEDLLSGQNIIVLTNHSDIKDIAEALGATQIAIAKVGESNNRPYSFTSNIVLSKMIAHLAYQGTPAVDILKLLCDNQFFSFPKTDSIRGTKIPSALVSAYNGWIQLRVRNQLHQGSNLFGIAPSGTTDKPDPGDPSLIHLSPVHSGTIRMLSPPNTKVLPMAIWKDRQQVVFEPIGTARVVRDSEEVHDIMEDISETLNKHVVGKTFEYSRPAAA